MNDDDRSLAMGVLLWVGIGIVLLGVIPALAKLVAWLRKRRRERARSTPYRARRFSE